MNPPFTRSVGGNLLFGDAPERQRARMQAELRRLVANQRNQIQASITAGLGSVFVAVGLRHVKVGGHIALVLPRALLSGVAWEPTRRLLAQTCHVRYVIVSHEQGAWNFSENTSLSECLIVARKLAEGEEPGPTKCVNLWEKPRSSVEALTLANIVRSQHGAALDGEGVEELRTNGKKHGEMVLCPASRVREGRWAEGTAFAQTELCRAAYYLSGGTIYDPERGRAGEIRMVAVSELADVGPDRRDIHDGFDVTSSETSYRAFWGHDTEQTETMRQEADRYLSPLPRARPGRNLRDARLLWSRAGRLMVAERLRLNTIKVVAAVLDAKALSNTWWPVAVVCESEGEAERVERFLAMWFNSSLGLLSLMAARTDTEGAWVELKKPVLEALRVPDPRELDPERLGALAAAFDEIAEQPLRRVPEIGEDETRARIDAAVMEALGLEGDLAELRRMIAAEPLMRALRR